MGGKRAFFGGLVVASMLLVAGCAGAARGGTENDAVATSAPTQTPWIVEQTVVVTRLVEVVATPTEAPPTPTPTSTPVVDLPGARDLAIVPRPPQSSISRYATTRKHLFLDYAYSTDGGQSADDLADYYTEAMTALGWELTRQETEDERHSLTFEPTAEAEAPLTEVDYVRVLIRGDIGEVAIVLNTLREITDWGPFIGP